ncbi:MAG: hypothetical protein Q4G45_08160 [Actinomycetia bacterium]|nr:hypothetical protein [Actinomycetes bacterium]
MTTAPAAPGRLGEPVEPQAAMAYLGQLGAWVTERRAELDELDSLILASADSATLTNDMVLSMSVWQAIKNRYDLLLTTWDSGRVERQQLEQLSSLIWGRLDDTDSGSSSAAAVTGLSVSLPEACRLSDALASQLRSKLVRAPGADQLTRRLRDLRAQLERLRDQVKLEPPASAEQAMAKVTQMAARTQDLDDRLSRGGDIGGMLGPLEIQAATLERDLIVGNTLRRQARDKLSRARGLREDLVLREKALTELVNQVVSTVTPAPKYAVPQVEALGPVPSSASQLDSYLARLNQVSAAMQVAQQAYAKALESRSGLARQMATQREQARSLGLDRDADLAALDQLVQRYLDRTPSPTDVVSRLVSAHAEAVRVLAPGGSA